MLTLMFALAGLSGLAVGRWLWRLHHSLTLPAAVRRRLAVEEPGRAKTATDSLAGRNFDV